MPGSFMRRVNDALMPGGSAWTPKYGGGLDRFLDGVAENAQRALEDLDRLAYIRSARKVPAELLPDLEREYGISPDDGVPEDDRRERLRAAQASRPAGSLAALQAALDKTGFGKDGYGLSVYQNGTPATDPASIIDVSYGFVAHEIPTASCAGNIYATNSDHHQGYYLVNGDKISEIPNSPRAGYLHAQAWPSASCAGYHENSYTPPGLEYESPADPRWWPFIFFVGGPAAYTRDGRIVSVAVVEAPAARRQELHRLILRAKTLHSWAGMKIRYV